MPAKGATVCNGSTATSFNRLGRRISVAAVKARLAAQHICGSGNLCELDSEWQGKIACTASDDGVGAEVPDSSAPTCPNSSSSAIMICPNPLTRVL
jgi:hypothetical protein